MIIVCIDPGFSSLGWGIIHVDKKDLDWKDRLLDVGTIRTKKASKKRRIYQNDDLIDRIRRIRSGLHRLEYKLPAKTRTRGAIIGGGKTAFSAISNCDYVAIEEMSWGFRGQVAWRNVGMAWAIITCVLEEHRKGMVPISPATLKEHMTGSATATKKAVREAIFKRPGYEHFEELLDSFPKGQHEHIGDAVAVGITSLSSDTARMFIK